MSLINTQPKGVVLKKTIEPLFIRKMTQEELNELNLWLTDLKVNGLVFQNKSIVPNNLERL